MSEILSPAHDDAWFYFIVAHARLTAVIDARLMEAKGPLSLGDYDVLLCLKRAPGDQPRLRLSDLAEAVTLSRSGLSRLVDRLEKAELLRRESCPTDRRGAYAVLTEKGDSALRLTWPVYAQAIHEHFARFVTEEEAKIITGALRCALSALGQNEMGSVA